MIEAADSYLLIALPAASFTLSWTADFLGGRVERRWLFEVLMIGWILGPLALVGLCSLFTIHEGPQWLLVLVFAALSGVHISFTYRLSDFRNRQAQD